MTTHGQREIVIEFERVRLIRKRAKTKLEYCKGCCVEANFVELTGAARLFGTKDSDLAAFIASNAVHTNAGFDICITSLLAVMHAKQNNFGSYLTDGRIL